MSDSPSFQALQDENARLRAALAVSKDPCIYCSLPADRISECKSGFPGCGRADDHIGCREYGASLGLATATSLLKDSLEVFGSGCVDGCSCGQCSHVRDVKAFLGLTG